MCFGWLPPHSTQARGSLISKHVAKYSKDRCNSFFFRNNYSPPPPPPWTWASLHETLQHHMLRLANKVQFLKKRIEFWFFLFIHDECSTGQMIYRSSWRIFETLMWFELEEGSLAQMLFFFAVQSFTSNLSSFLTLSIRLRLPHCICKARISSCAWHPTCKSNILRATRWKEEERKHWQQEMEVKD